MQQYLKQYAPQGYSVLIGLFFVLVLHFKISYSLIPILLTLTGLGLLFPYIKRRQCHLAKEDKWLIASFFAYFLFILLSLIIQKGKMNELDLPSRLLLVLPILAIFAKINLKPVWILYSIIAATLIAGIVAIIQYFVLELPNLFPAHMYIQAGDILMTLSLFSLASLFYFQQQKNSVGLGMASLATVLGVFGCLLNQARGPWVVAPIVLLVILWLNRHLFSKWIVVFLVVISLVGGVFAGKVIQKRVEQATTEISQYVDNNNGNTSIGARFDMWKSAWLGIQEKPIFGWGLQGVKEMRKQHFEQGKISQMASTFDHAHNQFLHDTSARGVIGFGALLALFLVPLTLFWRNLKQVSKNSLGYLWGCFGIIHILATMGYCMSQAFLSHNSGIIFYGFTTILLFGLQKISKNELVVGHH
ncbi:RfaL protein [Pasteurellaceae bacterium LFhippo2]|nr:RfaL protein [Pasteurellaceae bacterium LFhippo2]